MKAAFDYIAGTGGVGTGILFKLLGAHDLGRNESRLAELTDARDFCKLHIILHYAAKLLRGAVPVYPIGRVGADDSGRALLADMAAAGMDTRFMTADSALRTMYSVCFQYPNGEGGNLTASNSACDAVCAADIDRFFDSGAAAGRGMLLAAPEVPLDARAHLLARGRANGCTNAASLLSGEAAEFLARGLFSDIDLLAVNRDEAAAILTAAGEPFTDGSLADICIAYLRGRFPHMDILVTLGHDGALACTADGTARVPAFPATPVNTAGAGDCFLGTALACLACGLPLADAARLAALAAGVKVLCGETIDFALDAERLQAEAAARGWHPGSAAHGFLSGA